MPKSALYHCEVVHTRLRPKHHSFQYKTAMLLLDLDLLESTAEKHRFFSYNRWNILSFFDRDHGPSDGTPLRIWAENLLRENGVNCTSGEGTLLLLTLPRMFGYVFNPLSIYYYFDNKGLFTAVIYQVNNTFGDRHCYVIPLDGHQHSDAVYTHSADKKLFVSPFISMSATYKFHIREPSNSIQIVINEFENAKHVLTATLTGQEESLSNDAIISTAIRYPFLTFKVIGAIHWNALLLWLKRIPLFHYPTAEN